MPDTSSMAQQLQLSAAHLPILRAIMQRELQALTPRSPQLALAGRIQHQQNAQPAQQGPAAQQQRVEVVPLLGLCLSHILHTSSPTQRDVGMHPAGEAMPAAEVYAAMQHHSPFLNALQSELLSLRAASGTCYAQIKQHLASVGQRLPPATAGSSRASSDAANNTASPSGGTNSNSSRDYYGRGLDLHALQQQADAGALDLIHLEDCISSCATSLAKLAQQYDILITAALPAAAEHACGAAECAQGASPASTTPAKAIATGHKAGGLVGPLLGAMRSGSKQAGSKAAAASGQQFTDAVEYVFVAPGVCSHSSAAQTYGYAAGAGWLLCRACVLRHVFHIGSQCFNALMHRDLLERQCGAGLFAASMLPHRCWLRLQQLPCGWPDPSVSDAL